MSTKLKILSFNMRIECEADGENNFDKRKTRIAEFLKDTDADVIGFQEITNNMRAWLVDTLCDYYIVGAGRTSNYMGESCVVAFKKDRLLLISSDSVMLSTTPKVFGSYYDGSDQSRCPRLYVRLFLKHVAVEEPFYVYNVHTDSTGSLSRILASSQLLSDITSHDKKFFLTGDFNATPDTTEIKMITSCTSRRIVDTTASMQGTFHDFGRKAEPSKIDYIFTDADTKIVDAVKVEDKPVNTTYISDHNPIYIIAEI